MRALFADLDNTLIYSHRVELPGEKLCVEWLEGREQSYMTRATFEFLARREDLALVPVTTRTREQYARLAGLAERLGVRDALVCNGAVLLCGGEVDARWLEESRARAAGTLDGLAEAVTWLRRSCGAERVREADGLMAYAAADDPQRLAEPLRRALAGAGVCVLCDRRKLYCIPDSLDKGTALRRYRQRRGIERCIAAGDSEFDLPMLEAADAAIVPVELAARVRNPGRRIAAGGGCFSDAICQMLAREI